MESARAWEQAGEYPEQLLVDIHDPTTSIWVLLVCTYCTHSQYGEKTEISLPNGKPDMGPRAECQEKRWSATWSSG